MREHDQRDDYNDERPEDRDRRLANMVHWPSLIMGAIGIIQLAISVLGCLWLIGALIWNWINPEFFNNDGPEWLEVTIGTAGFLICAAANYLIVIGARRLSEFKNYRLVVWAVAISILSLPFFACWYVTVPIGIWALIIVLNRDVRARFKAVARGQIAGPSPEPSDARKTDGLTTG